MGYLHLSPQGRTERMDGCFEHDARAESTVPMDVSNSNESAIRIQIGLGV